VLLHTSRKVLGVRGELQDFGVLQISEQTAEHTLCHSDFFTCCVVLHFEWLSGSGNRSAT
jgi:hypothetical protein